MQAPKVRDVLDKEPKYVCDNVAYIEHCGTVVALQKWALTENSRVSWDEIDALKLEHKNLLKYYDIELIEKQETHGFHSRKLYSLAEYGKNMAYYYPNPSWDMIYSFARQIATGLNFLHTNGLIHGNLTAKNIFITNDLTVKLGRHIYPKNNTSNLTIAEKMSKDIFDYGKVLCDMILCCDIFDDCYDNFEAVSKMPHRPALIMQVITSCRKQPHERHVLQRVIELLSTEKLECMRDVILGDVIGQNSLAKVYKGSLNGRVVVAKQFDIRKFRKIDVREFDIYYALNHPNIVKFYGTFFNYEQSRLVMEYLPYKSKDIL